MHEINLLPPTRRLSLRRTTLLIALNKFLASLLLGGGLVTAVGIGTILTFWSLSIIAAGSTQAEFQLAQKNHRAAQEELNKSNIFFNSVQSLGKDRLLWAVFLKDFFAVVPPGVTVSSISGKIVEDSKPGSVPSGQLLFGGQAAARSTLTIFADRLKQVPKVTSVESPNANLIQRDNPQYTFKLSIGTPTTETKPVTNAPPLDGPIP